MTPECLILLLDDGEGICSKGYDALCGIVHDLEGNDGPMRDILNAVVATDGRFYLKEGR